jgi:GNAT superfamily N-acetyltransferase
VTELELKIPDGLACNRQWFIGFREHGLGLIAVEHIIKDLFIKGVWHIGLLILEASRHGKGDAQLIYAATEHWAVTQGARWLRIGVVRDNLRARRFWASQGFTKVCERRGVAMGLKENTIITMVKTLSGTSIPQYLQLVERDRP